MKIIKRKLNLAHIGIFIIAAITAWQHGLDWMALVAISVVLELGVDWLKPVISKHFGGSNGMDSCSIKQPITEVVTRRGNKLPGARGSIPKRASQRNIGVPAKNNRSGKCKPKGND